MELIVSKSFISTGIEDFIFQFKELNMICYASEAAADMNFKNFDELEHAIKDAIEVCLQSGLPIEDNFRRIYKCSSDGIIYDWKLSLLAYKLVCLNGDSSNPKVAQLQVELLKNQALNSMI